MNPESPGETPRPRWLTALGTFEGYAAACFTVIVFFVPVAPGTQRLSMIVVITLTGLGLGLGIGGIRFGEGGSRVAAWCAVVVLSLLCIAFVIKGIWELIESGRFL
jgi:hypothetical protein